MKMTSGICQLFSCSALKVYSFKHKWYPESSCPFSDVAQIKMICRVFSEEDYIEGSNRLCQLPLTNCKVQCSCVCVLFKSPVIAVRLTIGVNIA